MVSIRLIWVLRICHQELREVFRLSQGWGMCDSGIPVLGQNRQ